jgi:hypothetical protein
MKRNRTLKFKGQTYVFNHNNDLIRYEQGDAPILRKTDDSDDIKMPQELLDMIEEVKQNMEDMVCIPWEDIPPEEMKYYEVTKGSAEEDNLRELGLL